MTNDQEIRAAAAVAVFGNRTVPMRLDPNSAAGDRYVLDVRDGVDDELRAVEAYIRDGFDGPVAPFMTTATLREQQGH